MNHQLYLSRIAAALAESTGCTEPSAIALNAATARANARGDVLRIEARLDAYLYKNAMGVGIPGADERGVALCVALGVTAGDSTAGMNALHTVTAQQLAQAKALRGSVSVSIAPEAQGLYIETVLTTTEDCVRVITSINHDRIVRVEHAPFTPFVEDGSATAPVPLIASLEEYVAFADTVEPQQLGVLHTALEMNRRVYRRACEEKLDCRREQGGPKRFDQIAPVPEH